MVKVRELLVAPHGLLIIVMLPALTIDQNMGYTLCSWQLQGVAARVHTESMVHITVYRNK